MLLSEWLDYAYKGNPQFARDGEVLSITNDSADDAGSWFAWGNEDVSPGDKLIVRGVREGEGQVLLMWFSQSAYINHEEIVEDGQVVTAPDKTTGIRLDCRKWQSTGTATFTGMSVSFYVEPPVEPPEEPIELPVPEPDDEVVYGITGYHYGEQDISLWIHIPEGEELPNALTRGSISAIRGTLQGRNGAFTLDEIVAIPSGDETE